MTSDNSLLSGPISSCSFSGAPFLSVQSEKKVGEDGMNVTLTGTWQEGGIS